LTSGDRDYFLVRGTTEKDHLCLIMETDPFPEKQLVEKQKYIKIVYKFDQICTLAHSLIRGLEL